MLNFIFISLNKKRSSLLPVFLGLLIIIIGGCEILEVDDRGAIQEGDLTDPVNEELIVNGVRSEFQDAFINLSLSTAVFSGEAYIDHTNIDWRNFSHLNFNDGNAINLSLYNDLHQLRASAEDGLERLNTIQGAEEFSRNLDVAMTQVHAGYSYIYLGENFCSSPIDMSAAFTSEELLGMAIDRFTEAISTAGNAEQAGRDANRVAKVRNLANSGIARANLQIGNNDQAIQFASQVPEDFEAWAFYSNNTTRENNTWAQIGIPGSDQWVSVGVEFLNLNDPRVANTSEAFDGLNGNDIFLPYRPLNFEGWDPNNVENFIERSTNIRYASGLEAQYIIAEAQGPTQETEDFVNERRAVGNQSSVSLTGEALMEELRNQRARDLYFTGHRAGDLRRYLNLHQIDKFPTGPYPVGLEVYGDARCFIIPLEEKVGNPNL